jgi:hypothetical protein
MSNIKCVVCDGAVRPIDIPRHNLQVCTVCGEVMQVSMAGDLVPLSDMLKRLSLDDDRVRGVLSTPTVSTLKSFLDIFEQAEFLFSMNIREAKGGLRTLLAQIGNRIDSALQAFTGMDLVSDRAADGLRALREARELVSTLPSRNRGVPQEDKDVDPSE